MREDIRLAIFAMCVLLMLTAPVAGFTPREVWRGLCLDIKGKPDHAKVLATCTWGITAWVVVFATLKGSLSEWLLVGFFMVGTAGKHVGKYLAGRRADIKNEPAGGGGG